MLRRALTISLPLALGLWHWSASAEPSDAVPPWNSGVPLGEGIQSVRIARAGEPIYTAPDKAAPRRGAAQRLTRLPIYAHRSGKGCAAPWYLVGPSAWVCGDHAEADKLPPVAIKEPHRFDSGLALSYHFIKKGGALGYGKLSLLEEGIEDRELEAGFAVALVHRARARTGLPVGLTSHDLWVYVEDLRPAAPTQFTGVDLTVLPAGGAVGWVHRAKALFYPHPKPSGAKGRLQRFAAIRVLERQEHRGKPWLRIGPEQWIQGRDARVRTAASPPADVMPRERWIDVDTETQIVTAFEGTTPVFATLTSTGKGKEGSEQATPMGEHRIWVKLAASDMDNLEDDEANRYYAMQAVPWVMFFQKGYGLHGAYWHSSFGNVRSQGCVNLAPRDAQHLFHWARPKLPAGWSAVLPTEHDPGTRVVVR